MQEATKTQKTSCLPLRGLGGACRIRLSSVSDSKLVRTDHHVAASVVRRLDDQEGVMEMSQGYEN